MTDRNKVVVELSRSEAIALAKFIELGKECAEEQLLDKWTTRAVSVTKSAAAAVDKFAEALEDDRARCVSVDALVDLRELLQAGQMSEAHWLLTRIING